MSVDLDHIRKIKAEADCLFTAQEIQAAMDRMAGEIKPWPMPIRLCTAS